MTGLHVVLMCQGQQRRLPELKHPKHLLEVGGEPILLRTLRLLREHAGDRWGRVSGVTATVVGGADVRFAVARGPSTPPIDLVGLEEPGLCIVDGLLAVYRTGQSFGWGWELPEWKRRTLVLLGDVVWSRAALERVLADQRRLFFAGTSVLSQSQGEVFALGFDNPQPVINLCRSCPCRVDGSRLRHYKHPQGGHLRRLLWWAQDQQHLPLPNTRQTWNPLLYLPVDDWTDDVDTPQDVAGLPELARKIELEEQELAAQAGLVAG